MTHGEADITPTWLTATDSTLGYPTEHIPTRYRGAIATLIADGHASKSKSKLPRSPDMDAQAIKTIRGILEKFQMFFNWNPAVSMREDLDLFQAVEPKTCGNCGAVRVQL